MSGVTTQPSFLATRRGKLVLALLCGVAFLDFVDASIVNVALPSIRRALHFSVQGLVWVPSAYLLTYGGFHAARGSCRRPARPPPCPGRWDGDDRCRLADRRTGRQLGRADRGAARSRPRHSDDAPRGALDPYHKLQGGQGPEHRARGVGWRRRARVGAVTVEDRRHGQTGEFEVGPDSALDVSPDLDHGTHALERWRELERETGCKILLDGDGGVSYATGSHARVQATFVLACGERWAR